MLLIVIFSAVEEVVPEFRRHVGESEHDFLRRVDCETDAVIQQSQFNDKYHRVSVCRSYNGHFHFISFHLIFKTS